MKTKQARILSIILTVFLAVTMIPLDFSFAENPWQLGDDQGMQPYAGDNAGNKIGLVELGPDGNYSQGLSDVRLIERNVASGYYLNEIEGSINGAENITFACVMDAGMSSFSKDNFIINNLPNIKIYDESETAVIASGNDINTGEIKVTGTHQIDQVGTQGSQKTDAIFLEIEQGVLQTGDYILEFGKGIRGNNISKTLGLDVKYIFHVVAAPELDEMIARARDYLNEATIGAAPGQFSQAAADDLNEAIRTAQSVADNESATEEERTSASEELYGALDNFISSVVYEIESIKVSGVDSEINVGDIGTARETVNVDPDWDQFKKVTWSVVKEPSADSEPAGNIAIGERTGKWVALFSGTCYIKATSTSNPTKSSYFKVTVKAEEGVTAINLADSNVNLETMLGIAGVDPTAITSLKVYTTESGALKNADISYINSLPSLKEVDLSNTGMTMIPANAFAGNDGIEKVRLADSVTAISYRAFYNCSNLRDIELPAGLISLGGGAFAGCISMNDTLVSKAAYPPTYSTSSMTAYGDSFKGNAEDQASSVKTIEVPYSCKSDYEQVQGWSAFAIQERDQHILNVHLTESGTLAQAATVAMENDNISESDVTDLIITSDEGVQLGRTKDITEYLQKHILSATTIDLSGTEFEENKCNANHFKGRISLKHITLPDTTMTIGSQCFYGCKNLRDIVLPSSLNNIGDGAFGGCNRLPDTLMVMAETPAKIQGSVFPTQVDAFRVPPGSEDAYNDASIWNTFDILPQVELSLDNETTEVRAASKTELNASLRIYNGKDYAVQWSTDKESVLELSADTGESIELSGIRPGNATVTASICGGVYTATCNVNVKNALDAPETIEVTSTSGNSVDISWGEVDGTEAYEVFRATSEDGDYEKLITLAASTLAYCDTGVQSGTEYYYKVRGYKTIDGVRYAGAYSDIANVTFNAAIKVRVKKTAKLDVSGLAGTVTFKSGNKKIATVSSTGLVKGVKVGTTKITVKASGDATHEPVTYDVKVTVPTVLTRAALTKTSYSYDGENHRPNIKTINKKKSLVEGTDYSVKWPEESVNAGTYYAVITATKNGKYDGTVKAKYTIKKAKRTIKCDKPAVYVNEIAKLEPTTVGTGTVKYKSSSTKIATVDADGNVKGIKKGKVKITITVSSDDNYLKATKTLTIYVVKK